MRRKRTKVYDAVIVGSGASGAIATHVLVNKGLSVHRSNRCEIDPAGLKDRYGIPQLRFDCEWGDNEKQMAEIMYDEAEAILRAAGAEVMPYERPAIPPVGDQTHEVGSARMGDDPKTSVLNGFCQTHDVKNLFVVDGSSFVSGPEKNCTLTIIALAWRASDYLAAELRKGNLNYSHRK